MWGVYRMLEQCKLYSNETRSGGYMYTVAEGKLLRFVLTQSIVLEKLNNAQCN